MRSCVPSSKLPQQQRSDFSNSYLKCRHSWDLLGQHRGHWPRLRQLFFTAAFLYQWIQCAICHHQWCLSAGHQHECEAVCHCWPDSSSSSVLTVAAMKAMTGLVVCLSQLSVRMMQLAAVAPVINARKKSRLYCVDRNWSNCSHRHG